MWSMIQDKAVYQLEITQENAYDTMLYGEKVYNMSLTINKNICLEKRLTKKQ